MPSITNVELVDEDTLRFHFLKTSPKQAATLRKIMMTETPTMAIDKVDLLVNTTVSHDQFLSHRIGLIPFRSASVDQFKFTEECSCTAAIALGAEETHCTACSVYLELNVRNDSDSTRDITSADFKLQRVPQNAAAHLIIPIEPPILIMQIRKGQALHVKAVARKGTGAMNVKWSCMNVAFFQPLRNDTKAHETTSTKGAEGTVAAIKPTQYLFEFEATGQLAPQEILLRAWKKFNDDAGTSTEELKMDMSD